MINKFLKLSKISLLGLGLIFGIVNVNAEETLMSDNQKEEVAADMQSFAQHIEHIIEHDFQTMWGDLRNLNTVNSGIIHYSHLSNSATSLKYNAEMAVNTNGTPTLTIGGNNYNVTGIYYKFSNDASVPVSLRNKTIALVLEHGAFNVNLTPSTVKVDDFKCYTDINSTSTIASYVGESVSNQGSTVNLIQFTELGFDRASPITSCKLANFLGDGRNDTSGPRQIYTAPTSNGWFKLKPL